MLFFILAGLRLLANLIIKLVNGIESSLLIISDFFFAVLQDDKRGGGMLPADVSNIESNYLIHRLIEEEIEESKYEPAFKDEPLHCDDPESVEDAKVSY